MSALNQAGRDDLLRRMEEVKDRMYGPREDRLATEVLRALNREHEQLKAADDEGLPATAVSCCPFCAEFAFMAVDLFGLDGPWWEFPGKAGPGDAACAHRLVTLGALDLGRCSLERAAPLSTGEIQPGPAVPFVVPRLMALAGMMCVLYATRRMAEGSTAYFMTYFADPPVSPEVGHQPWLRNQYWYLDAGGNPMWNVGNDQWDFELSPWLASDPQKLAWIAADDGEMAIHSDTGELCPYTDLPGRRQPVSIRQGRVYDLPLPNGGPVEGEDLFD